MEYVDYNLDYNLDYRLDYNLDYRLNMSYINSNSGNGINNLNILTFIKDIYQSLKTIDCNFNNLKENINIRMTKLEDNQQVILTRLENIEILLNKIDDKSKENVKLDKNIEKQLLNKINEMNEINNLSISNNKLDLKPKELTISNLLENNYSFEDINNSLAKIGFENNFENHIENNINKNIENHIESDTLQSLLF